MSSTISALQTALAGQVLHPDHPGYDTARSVWNAGIDHRPAMIARCESATDVATAIEFGREHDLEISVRGGGHNPSGVAVCEGGLMIHLGGINGVSVDPAARRVRVGGGALLGDMDAATQEHGLATTAGTVSHTGIGGLTLGGGIGWLGRRYGLTMDNLVSAEIVTAAGRVFRVSQHEDPELFWALRGGGGNFGVVTEFEFRLHEVGPVVHYGMFFFGLEQGAEALRMSREVAADAPLEITVSIVAVNAPPAPAVPEQYHFQPGYAVLTVGFGTCDQHRRVATRIRQSVPPLFELVSPMTYLELQHMLDGAHIWGQHSYEKSLYLEDLSDAAISVITEQMPGKSSPLSYMHFFPLDGAYRDVEDDDTAWSGRRSGYEVSLVGLAPTPDLLDRDRAWVRSSWEALLPHARGPGGYINAMTEFGQDRVRASYGPAKYQRLAQIKAIHDPDNVFHGNGNIRPDTGSKGRDPGPAVGQLAAVEGNRRRGW